MTTHSDHCFVVYSNCYYKIYNVSIIDAIQITSFKSFCYNYLTNFKLFYIKLFNHVTLS